MVKEINTNELQSMKLFSLSFKTLGLAIAGLFILQSCNDSATAMLEEADLAAAEDEVLISEFEEECGHHERFEFAHELRGPGCGDWKEKLPDCAVVTESGDDYPKTTTVEFGDDCEDRHGRKRNGQMTIVISDDMKNEGATRTITFERFGMDDHSVKGTRVIENIGQNANGNYVFKRTSTIQGSGKRGDFTRTSEGEMEWLEGFDTEDCYDNVVSITGSSTTIKDGEQMGGRKIVEPIVKSFDCKHPVSGVVELTGPKGNVTIDFGDGECNSLAEVTKDDVVSEIDLDQRKECRGKRRHQRK